MDLPSRNHSIKQCNQCADSKPSSCYLRMFVIILHLFVSFICGKRDSIPSSILKWIANHPFHIFNTPPPKNNDLARAEIRYLLTMIVPQFLHSFPAFSPCLPHQQTLRMRCFRRPWPRRILSLCNFLGTEHIVVFVIAKLTRFCLGFIAIVNGTINQQT